MQKNIFACKLLWENWMYWNLLVIEIKFQINGKSKYFCGSVQRCIQTSLTEHIFFNISY